MRFPFIIGLHNHQPYLNYDHVIDEVVKKSYHPFMEVAQNHPDFLFAVHYSGWLLDKIASEYPETFMLLKKLHNNGQVEFFGGGYYEPVLSAISSKDRRGQINMLSNSIENHFGVRPKGLWLTERVWDSSIIPDLCECGIEDVIVDDYHFMAAGFNESTVKGYFRTEHDGYAINVFPVDKGLRYRIPFSPVKDIIDYIKESKNSGKKLITCFDDGEKFGVWPKTYDWVYASGWLEEFMSAVEEEPEIRTCHFETVKNELCPQGMAYLPVTSYPEMGEWSLFTDMQLKIKDLEKFVNKSDYADSGKMFIKGGIWKNFFIKYPESNRIHKRAMELSKKYQRLLNKGIEDSELENHIFAAQCNDCLWHGSFGGLYLANLRENAWTAIIDAEKRYEYLKKIEFPHFTNKDSDLDGFHELYLRTEKFNVQFVCHDGGQIASIEYKPASFNILNTVARRPEAYHYIKGADTVESHDDKTEKSGGKKISTIHQVSINADEYSGYLYYDWYNKNCFIDHFVHKFDKVEFERGLFKELGDFVNQPFSMGITDDGCVFTRNGGIFTTPEKTALLAKRYTIDKDTIKADYDFQTEATCDYVMEHNFHFNQLELLTINGEKYTDKRSFVTDRLTLFDNYTKCTVELNWNKEMDIYIYTVNTVSLAVDELNLNPQGICILAATSMSGGMNFSSSLRVY